MSSQRLPSSARVTVAATQPSTDIDAYSRAIFDHVLDCITVADCQGRIEYGNAAACKTFGYSREEFLQKSIPELIAPDEVPRLVQMMRSRGTDNVSYGEWRSLRKDGSLFFAEVSVATLSDGRLLGIGRDITQRKQAESELNQTQQMLEAFVDHAPAAVAMFDRNMCYLRSSRQWRIATGLPDEPLAGKCHYDVFPNIPEEWRAAHRRGLAGEIVKGETAEWIRADGAPVRYRWEVHPWGDAGADTSGVIVMFEDVTESRRLEAQLRNAQKMDAIGRLAGGVAHEFRNALCVILLQLDLAKGGVAAESEVSVHLEAIQKAARHAGTITENLLAFSRKRTFNPEPFSLDNFVRELGNIVRPLAGDNIRLDLHCNTGDATVLFDPMQLEQVLINLVCNAVDAISSTGEVTIETRRHQKAQSTAGGESKDYLVLSVADTGSGIEPESLPHIFEPFYTTKAVGKGTGLGLSISYGIVTQGGGSIEVESVAGKGSRFNVLLPMYEKL